MKLLLFLAAFTISTVQSLAFADAESGQCETLSQRMSEIALSVSKRGQTLAYASDKDHEYFQAYFDYLAIPCKESLKSDYEITLAKEGERVAGIVKYYSAAGYLCGIYKGKQGLDGLRRIKMANVQSPLGQLLCPENSKSDQIFSKENSLLNTSNSDLARIWWTPFYAAVICLSSYCSGVI